MNTFQPHKDRWWSELTGYHWFVFAIAGGAWLFDNFDQRIFSLARIPALKSLMGAGVNPLEVQAFAKQATALFLIGWGVGGLVLGALGDRFGRARLLTISVLLYSVCTGLTAICQTHWEFALLRLMTGIGIGGVFGMAVALIAETVPGTARLAMLALLQIMSTVGNIGAAFAKMGVDSLAGLQVIEPATSWRWLFAIGALPAILAVASGLFLKEPEAWLRLKQNGELPDGWFGSYRQLLADSVVRQRLLIGTLLSISGVVGLWAVGEYAVDLQDAVFNAHFAPQFEGTALVAKVAQAKNWAYLLQMAGGAAGMIAFTYVADRFGRRPAFTLGFAAALITTFFVFWQIETPSDAYWMMPMMGAAQLSIFAGFSIYLPELFGPLARGTGVSFAYNMGRFVAAGGSFVSAYLSTRVFSGFASPAPLRYSAMAMSLIFVLGIVVSWLAPETRNRQQTA